MRRQQGDVVSFSEAMRYLGWYWLDYNESP